MGISTPRITFLKMDIEGGEAIVLPAIKNWIIKERPVLALSLHPPRLPDPAHDIEVIKNVLSVFPYLHSYSKKAMLLSDVGLTGPKHITGTWEPWE